MATKVAIVLRACLKHCLLVLAEPVDPVHLLLVALPDALHQLPLLLEALLWDFHGDEGGSSNIARAYYVAESDDIWRNFFWIRRPGWQPQLSAKLVQVLKVI